MSKWPGRRMLTSFQKSRWRSRVSTIPATLFLLASFSPTWADALSADSQTTGNLKQLSLEALGNLAVTTATKEPEPLRKVPAAIYVITQEDIRRSGATTLPDVLRLAPGVEIAQVDSDHWSIAIRGFGAVLASKLLVLIDGRSVYTPLFAGVYWEAQDTPLEDIDRIEVIRGPGGTIWGANAVNGIINIITKSAKDTHGSMVSMSGGNVDQGTATYRHGGGDGRGLDYAFDFAGVPVVRTQADSVLARDGALVLVGLSGQALSIANDTAFSAGRHRVLGHYGGLPVHLEELIKLAGHGRLDFSGSISGRLKFEDAAEAVRQLAEKVNDPIRLVLVP